MEEDEQTRVVRLYQTPGHPTAFSAPKTVSEFHGIPLARAKEYLEHINAYVLHRQYKKPRVYNPYYVHERRKQVQADLIDVSKLARENRRVRFLILLIDIFTKKVWVRPLRSKRGDVVARCIDRWARRLAVKPQILKTDRGLEFRNRHVQRVLRSHGIEWQEALGTLKACIAERANRSLQELIYKYMSANETVKYIGVLQKLVRTYNDRPHRTLKGLTPRQADLPRNEAAVQAIFHQRYAKYDAVRRRTQRNMTLEVGDLVRVKTESPSAIHSSRRAYAEQFHGEYYRIVAINRTLPVPMYYLRSLDTGERIRGGFYAGELQRTRGNVYLIERVHRRRTVRGQRQLLVKWKWFGPRHNQWIRADELVRAF